MNIVLHIERLVLEGIPTEAGLSTALQQAVQVELARLLATGGLAAQWQRGGAVRNVAGSEFTLPSRHEYARPAGAGVLGARIAASIHTGLGGVQR
jgi:hypothetical protein